MVTSDGPAASGDRTIVEDGTALERGAVGFVPILFQSITHIAPAVGVAFAITVGVSYAGGSVSLSVVLALVVCLLVAGCIWQLARYLPSAGGLYTYSSRGLGSPLGFLVGWAYIGAEPLALGFLMLIFGNVISANLTSHFNAPTWLWVPFTIGGGLLIWALIYRGVKLSTKAGVLLGLFEIGIFLALALTLIIEAGSRNTLSVFGPSTGNPNGVGGIFSGLIFAIFAFIGFDGAAPLAEEAAEPRRTVPRAIFYSTLFIGLFFVFCYYGATVYFGPDKMASATNGFLSLNDGDPWTGLANKVWGIFGILILLAVVNSAIANGNAAANAATRVGFALGRIRLLPHALSRVHPKHRTPHIAIHVEVIYSMSLAVIMGFVAGSPLNGFAFLGTVGTLLFIPMYMITCLASIVFYAREHRDEFNIFLHVIVPVAAIALFIPVMLAGLGINFLNLGIPSLSPPINVAPFVSLGWMIIGVIVLFYFRAKHPERIEQTGTVFVEQEASAS